MHLQSYKKCLSLPSWERGLKYADDVVQYVKDFVAPFVGAWIEIHCRSILALHCSVAPFVGAWIEIEYSRRQ